MKTLGGDADAISPQTIPASARPARRWRRLPRATSAQSYPARPVRVVVGAVPGSAPDVSARLVADWLSRRLGQTFFVENRNGASGNLATEEVAAAPPDGYTLLLASASNAINVTLYTISSSTSFATSLRSPAWSRFRW